MWLLAISTPPMPFVPTNPRATFHISGRRSSRRGFTLLELLISTTIIALISSIGMVSYEKVKINARDAKRVSDIKQIQTSLEIFFESHGYYPPDRIYGPEGEILGMPETKYLTDVGFAPKESGTTYIILPKNPLPNGSNYVYRSINRNGSDCDTGDCEAYVLLFTLERPQGRLLAGPHAITPEGVAGAEGGGAGLGVAAGGQLIGIQGVRATVALYADLAIQDIQAFANDPTVQATTEVGVAPAAATIAVANVATAAHAGASTLQYVFFLLTQPFALFSRRKRKSWGVVYNSLSKLPEDLVVVRLRDAASNRIVKSAVTDVHGTFSFLARSGQYRIEAVKFGFTFPSSVIVGLKVDGQYAEPYGGDVFESSKEGALIAPNIPVDPVDQPLSDEKVAAQRRVQELQQLVAGVGPLLGGVAVAIKPSWLVGSLFIFQVAIYLIFRRLAMTSPPKSWGVVFDEEDGRPIAKAVVRIFEGRFNKLLETQITDSRGRYHFRVGNNIYYLTITKPGYFKTETDKIDLLQAKGPTVIATHLPIRRVGAVIKVDSATKKQKEKEVEKEAAPPTPPPPPPPAAEPPTPPPPPEPPKKIDAKLPENLGGSGKSAEPPPYGDIV